MGLFTTLMFEICRTTLNSVKQKISFLYITIKLYYSLAGKEIFSVGKDPRPLALTERQITETMIFSNLSVKAISAIATGRGVNARIIIIKPILLQVIQLITSASVRRNPCNAYRSVVLTFYQILQWLLMKYI